MITTILMDKAKPEGGARQLGDSDDPIVAVKQPAEDLHGDMRRGENRMKALFKRRKPGREWRRRGEHKREPKPMRSQRPEG